MGGGEVSKINNSRFGSFHQNFLLLHTVRIIYICGFNFQNLSTIIWKKYLYGDRGVRGDDRLVGTGRRLGSQVGQEQVAPRST